MAEVANVQDLPESHVTAGVRRADTHDGTLTTAMRPQL